MASTISFFCVITWFAYLQLWPGRLKCASYENVLNVPSRIIRYGERDHIVNGKKVSI
jgi:hypothetical protein